MEFVRQASPKGQDGDYLLKVKVHDLAKDKESFKNMRYLGFPQSPSSRAR